MRMELFEVPYNEPYISEKCAYTKLVTHAESHASAVSLLKRAENSAIIIKAINKVELPCEGYRYFFFFFFFLLDPLIIKRGVVQNVDLGAFSTAKFSVFQSSAFTIRSNIGR